MIKDGKIVAIHDEDLKRTSTGEGAVKDFDLRYLGHLKFLNFGSWFSEKFEQERIPTLQEVFIGFNKDETLILEFKIGEKYYPKIVERAIDIAAS